VYGLGRIFAALLGEAAVPARLRAIRERATAPEAADRFESVDALNDDVGRYLAGRPVTAYRESLAERLGRVLQPHRTAILLVLAYLLMRVLLLFFRP
jgi:hypothetical protein